MHNYVIGLLRKIIRNEVQLQNDKTGVIVKESKIRSKINVKEINRAIADLEKPLRKTPRPRAIPLSRTEARKIIIKRGIR